MLNDLVTLECPTPSISHFHKQATGDSGLRQNFTGPTRAVVSVIGPYPLTLTHPSNPFSISSTHPPPFLSSVDFKLEVNRSERRHCEIGVAVLLRCWQ